MRGKTIKKSQVEKVAKDLLQKYGEGADSKIAECARKAQSKGDDQPLRVDKEWAEVLASAENVTQAKFLGCLTETSRSENVDWKERAKEARRKELETGE